MKNTKVNYIITVFNSLFAILLLFVFWLLFFTTDNSLGTTALICVLFLIFPISILVMEWQGIIRGKYKYLSFYGTFFTALGCLMVFGATVGVFKEGLMQENLFTLPIYLYFLLTGIYRIKFCEKYNKITIIEYDL